MPRRGSTFNLAAFGICGLVFSSIVLPVSGNTAVSDNDFLLQTTGDLVALCRAAPADPYYTAAINFCHGFTVGAYRVLEAENRADMHHIFCLPDPPPRRAEAISAFAQWVDANPDQKTLRPEDGIAAYMMKQFPCDRSKRQ
jgi:Rap1a immunity proteins